VAEEFEELEKLSSKELRHRAFELARKRRDAKFFWNVMKMIPASESAEGQPELHMAEVESSRLWLLEFFRPGHHLEDAMRPIFIDYIETYGAGGPAGYRASGNAEAEPEA
jgi:hypothetical protein